MGDQPEPPEQSLRRARAALELQADHAAEARQGAARERMIGVGREAGIVHPREGRRAPRPTGPRPGRWRCAAPSGPRASSCPGPAARPRGDRSPGPRAAAAGSPPRSGTRCRRPRRRSTSLWPFRYLVALVMTTSAPCSSGRKLIGLAKVESTRSARPCSFGHLGDGARSSTRISGLVGDSTKMARVSLRERLAPEPRLRPDRRR